MITGQQSEVQFNFLGVPLPDTPREEPIADRRTDPRVLSKGKYALIS
jgi:hypothetical protein